MYNHNDNTFNSYHVSYRIQVDYILCNQRWRSSIWSEKTRPGVVCGSDHELLIAKFRLKWKKVGKTSKPCKYDLNQIPYNYRLFEGFPHSSVGKESACNEGDTGSITGL